MKSRVTPEFVEAYGSLPEPIRRAVQSARKRFEQDQLPGGLRFKEIRPRIYSVRLNENYRAVGRREGDAISWFWVGLHSDYDRIIRGL